MNGIYIQWHFEYISIAILFWKRYTSAGGGGKIVKLGPGISEYIASMQFPVDNLAPAAPIGLTITPNAWSNTNSFQLEWTNPNDISGISKAYYKFDNPPVSNYDGSNSSGDNINQIDDVSVSGLGKWEIYLWLEDGAGNIDFHNVTSQTLYFDNVNPCNFTPQANPSTWTSNKQPTITNYETNDNTDYTDEVSKIDRYEVKVDDGEFKNINHNYSYQPPPQEDGIHTITIRAYDAAGNTQDGSVPVYIDTKPPLPFKPQPDPIGWTNNTQPKIMYGTVDDTSITNNVSGIDHYEVKIDDGNFSYINKSGCYQLPFQEDGVHNITIRVYDKAGNHIDGTTKVYITTNKPVVSFISHNNNDWVACNNVNFTWYGYSPRATIDKYEVCIDNKIFKDIGMNTSYTAYLNDDGHHNIIIKIHDSARNVEEYSLIINIDTQGPDIEFTSPKQDNVFNYTKINVTWTASDEGIGTDGFFIRLNTKKDFDQIGNVYSHSFSELKDGKYTIFLKGIDKLGNENIIEREFAINTGEEIKDRDGDGYIDDQDAFPDDPAASLDTDGDGYPDMWNRGYDGSDSTTGLILGIAD